MDCLTGGIKTKEMMECLILMTQEKEVHLTIMNAANHFCLRLFPALLIQMKHVAYSTPGYLDIQCKEPHKLKEWPTLSHIPLVLTRIMMMDLMGAKILKVNGLVM